MASNCSTTHDLSENAKNNIFGTYTFYDFNKILAGACTGVACLVVLFHLFNHATHLSVPREQMKIMRIACLIPLYAVFGLIGIIFPEADAYLDPWSDIFEANSLVAFFLLLCEYVSQHHEQRAAYFSGIELSDKKATKNGVDGATWFRQRWCMIFQLPVFALLAAIATDVTLAIGIYCQYETSAHHAKLYLEIVRNVSQAAAITAVFLVATTLKSQMPQHKPVRKLIAIKLVVGLTFLQDILFWLLTDTNAMKTSDTLTYADIKIGIPNLVRCVEMVPLAFVMAWSYPVKDYVYRRDAEAHQPTSYQGGFLGFRAILGMFDPTDTVVGVVRAVKMVIGEDTFYRREY